ncbi:MarR family winged helix-turn-helix transcriptional regulator [Spirillospora sp. CA-142024]|uniref:MarR family winged helix-turn-helix transcriptional regulator n=1 Tax=Spirillospora sp. CA-142024 TaxID=3240036 RepID=UPI003D8D8084
MERVSMEAAAEIRHGIMRVSRRMRAARSPEALSGNKLVVLGHLYRNGPASAGELAEAEGQRPQSLTRVFAELEADGLISRARAEQDRRQVVLTITEQGTDALRRDVGERDAWLAGALDGLTETERDVLLIAARLMERIAE